MTGREINSMNSLVYLRRMIISQKQARIDYTKGRTTKSLYYERAGFEGSLQDVVEKLREVFLADSVSVVATTDFNPMIQTRIFAPQAIAAALAGFTFDAEMRATLLSFVMRLPPLIVRLYPMQRYAFQDNSIYLKMHMQYQHYGVLRMQNFISQAESPADEIIRLRVLIATYVLGLIAPLNAASESTLKQDQGAVKKKKVSILSRIMNRIRGL